MTNNPRVPIWLWLSLAITVALCLVSIKERVSVESHNKRIGMAAEYDTVEALALSQGVSVEQALQQLKLQGLVGVTLPEETIGELLAEGNLTFDQIMAGNGDLNLRKRLSRAISIRFPKTGDAPLPIAALRSTSVGLNPDQARIVRDAGLVIIARLNNPQGLREAGMVASLEWARELGATVYLPTGDQVLGRRESIGAMIDTLKRLDMTYASPEFAKIGGDANVLDKAPERVVRLHAAMAAELDKLSDGEAVDRYVRAATERSMRWLLLRPVSFVSASPLDNFGEFMGKVKANCAKEGYGTFGPPRPFSDTSVPKLLFLVIGLSLIPTAAWTLMVLQLPRPVYLGLGMVFILLALVAYSHSGRQLTALGAATLMPVTAFLVVLERQGKVWFVEILLASLVSLVGGLCVAGLLNGLPYFIRADQFMGVKLAHFLPILLIGVIAYSRLGDLKAAWNSPMVWSQAALGVLILVALAFMATRTGNDNPAGVSGFETKLRSLLEAVFPVRPRTKEFMVGHPGMVVGLGMLALLATKPELKTKLGGWTALALMVGAIGQTSVVNTMCHLHTPIMVGLIRIAVGLGVGMVFGAILWTGLRFLLNKNASLPGADST